MNATDPQTLIQWQEALRWLDLAAVDIHVARKLIGDEVAIGLFAFHVQQAAEKILKALLVAASEDIRKSHDLEELATLANRCWPDIVPLPFPIALASRWYIDGRYPDTFGAVPSAAEISAALEQVDALRSAVLLRAPPELRAGRAGAG